ncbi:putative dimeric alpha-beta barrel protein [Crocosphaera subtropica ATCC 51142]|uniref:Dimeric alpha-beta barrel protein n=1 Tax=Crocosphaera subtropica (strain ATCC 51142 / BH68) TaxID=43989 RepID=B1WT71_CROS5|nr:TIGR03792 family protein [Crocosphaera subtropica]ACB51993.1 putative dimeric alpha-beta barrel protein [Crocosphaera subtropica ATCC 51142]
MVIEWLKFQVSPESRDIFIQLDNEIWTPVLAEFPGFLGKEVWISPNIPQEVTLIIRWETREQWKAIPQTLLEETEQKFAQRMQDHPYEMIEVREYQVRKFPNS